MKQFLRIKDHPHSKPRADALLVKERQTVGMTSQQNTQPTTGSIPYRPHSQVGESAPHQRTVIRGNAVSHSSIDPATGAWSKPPTSQLAQAQQELHVAQKENRSNFVFFLVILAVALILGAFLAQLMFPASAWDFSNQDDSHPTALAPFVLHELALPSSSS